LYTSLEEDKELVTSIYNDTIYFLNTESALVRSERVIIYEKSETNLGVVPSIGF
jgi:hypothetical protein